MIKRGTIPKGVMENIRGLLLEQPFHRFCGIKIVKMEPGYGVIRLKAGPNVVNPVGVFHGGILYALMDVACYVGIVPTLNEGENAVSHDAHFSILRSAKTGSTLELRGRTDKRGKNIAFIRVEAWTVDKGKETLVATGMLTKSITHI